jgi:hypothetical protein
MGASLPKNVYFEWTDPNLLVRTPFFTVSALTREKQVYGPPRRCEVVRDNGGVLLLKAHYVQYSRLNLEQREFLIMLCEARYASG